MMIDRVYTRVIDDVTTVYYSSYSNFEWHTVMWLDAKDSNRIRITVANEDWLEGASIWVPEGCKSRIVADGVITVESKNSIFELDFTAFNYYFLELTDVKDFVFNNPALTKLRIEQLGRLGARHGASHDRGNH